MAEISNNVRKQLLQGNVAALTKNGRVSCVTRQIVYSDDSQKDTTAIICDDHPAPAIITQLNLLGEGLLYTYERSGNTSAASLQWIGEVKVQGQQYTVVVEDKNLNGKIDSPASDPKITDTDTEFRWLPQVDEHFFRVMPTHTHLRGYLDVTEEVLPAIVPTVPLPDIAIPPADIIEAAEAQFQSALRAAGLLPK